MADVVIAHRDAIVRQAIGAVLEVCGPEHREVVYVRDGMSALTLCRQHRPDLLFLDAKITGFESTEVIKSIQSEQLGTKVVAFSLPPATLSLAVLVRSGAAGCLVLGEDYEAQVAAAVTAIQEGLFWLSPELVPLLADQFPGMVPGQLSIRELEVLTLVGKGLTNAEIAARLSVSKFTVKIHLSAIYSKLDLADRSQALLYAIRQGLVDPYQT